MNSITKLMAALGIHANVKGYVYTVKGIEIIIDTPDVSGKFMSVVYGGIAQKHDASPMNIERCIRSAIHSAYNKCPDKFSILWFDHKPTVSEFLANAAVYISEGLVNNNLLEVTK